MPITILIADDNRMIRETLQILIGETEHMRVIGEAVNGEQAIELSERLQPDIILMDINMSPLNGFEATGKILEKNPAIKVIGLSLHTEMSYCRRMLRLGARGYVAKTSAGAQIVDAIDEVSAGGQYIDRTMMAAVL